MRPILALLMLAAALTVVPAASASDACSGPGTAAEACYSTGSESGDVHSRTIWLGGCIISIQGKCVPDSASVGTGPSIAAYSVPTVYVGADVNVCPPTLPVHCSMWVNSAPLTVLVTSLT